MVCCCISLMQLHAQYMGVKAGIGSLGDTPEYMFGLTYEQFINHHFSVGLGLMGSTNRDPLQGYYYRDYQQEPEYKRLWRISIPLTVEYKYLLTDRLRLYAAAGASVNLTFWDDEEERFYNEEAGWVDYAGYKVVTPGLVAELGAEYRNWRLGVRYDGDLTTLTKFDTDRKIRSVMFTVGFRFGGNNNFRKFSAVHGSSENY